MMKILAPLGAVGCVALFMSWPKLKDKPQVRNALDPLKLKLPVFGRCSARSLWPASRATWGTMMKSGVPDPAEPRHRRRARPATSCLERAVRACRTAVRQGEALAGPLTEPRRSSRRWSCR
jgi:type IV pilus assembly protein PilC